VSGFWVLLRRELRLAARAPADALAASGFLLATAVLFPLAMGPSPELLARAAPGIVWVAALLATLLPLDRLWGAEADEGGLDQLLLSGVAPSLVAAAKAAGHWLTTGVPLAVLAWPIARAFGIGAEPALWLAGTLALGTPTLSLLGTAAAALAVGARRGGALLPLILLPLCIPVLVMGAGAADAVLAGLDPWPNLMLLGALLALTLPLAPLAAGAALRLAVE